MNKLTDTTDLLKRFGTTDALYRSTAWSAGIVFSAIVATMAGYGVSAILLSTLVQFLISGLLDFPTGLLADKFGHRRSVLLGFGLKILVTLSIMASFWAAKNNNITAAYGFLILEAIIDAFANSFISGAYQAAYQNFYKSECDARSIPNDKRPSLFLASFKYGLWIRLLMPLFFTGLAWVASRNSQNIENFDSIAALLLLAVFVLRFIVLGNVYQDLKKITDHQIQNQDNPSSFKILIYKAANELVDKLPLTVAYVVASLSQLTASMYLVNRAFSILKEANFTPETVWLVGMFGGIGLQYAVILASRLIYPKVTSELSRRFTPHIFVFCGLLFLLNAAVGNFYQPGYLVFSANLTAAILVTVFAGGAIRAVTSLALEVVNNKVAASWLSGASTLAYLLFSAVAGFALLIDTPELEPFFVSTSIGLICLTLGFVILRSFNTQTGLSLKTFLTVSTGCAVTLFSIASSALYTRIFVNESAVQNERIEASFIKVLESSLRQPLLQGSYIEAKARLMQFSQSKDLSCAKLTYNEEIFSTCDDQDLKSPVIIGKNGRLDFNDPLSSQPLATYEVYFDRSNTLEKAKRKVILSLLLSCLFGAFLFIILNYAVRIVAKELLIVFELANGSSGLKKSALQINEFSDLAARLEQSLLDSKALDIQTAIASTTQMLAHDIRKPFSMFKMLVDNVQNAKSTQEASRVLSDSLPEVNQSLAAVEGMIQDVMQIGADTTAVLEHVSPESIIEASLGELFRVYPNADVTLKYNLRHLYCVQADTLKIGRVFANILGNALQAMGNSGGLWIETNDSHGRVEFVLGNSGSVIPSESLEKLFDAFYTSGKKGGTGLGLAIAKKAIELHGGKIICRSDRSATYPTGFVEFVFSLPQSTRRVDQPTSALPANSSEVQATFKRLLANTTETEVSTELESDLERKVIGALSKLDSKPTLLVVDDEAVYRNALVSLVSRSPELSQKIIVATASNSTQAFALCDMHNPLLILQDIDLGKESLNGLELIEELRKRNFKGHVCVHSNRFLPEDNKNAMASGANFVIPKPMGRAHLLKILLSSLPANVIVDQRNSVPAVLPKIVYIDDSTTFLFGFKRTLEGKAEVQTFKTSTVFLQKIASSPSYFSDISLIVTDYYFDPTDPMNGLSLAQKLRQLGYVGPLVLASDIDLNSLEAEGLFAGKISKSSFDWHEIRNYIPS